MASLKAGKGKARRNEEIKTKEVRLIDAEGEQVGVVPLEDALERADQADLDLVEVAPNAEPPVCRIMDYGKYLFEQKKKAHEAKKKQKQIQIKEVKFRPHTEEGDYSVKLRNMRRFLEHEDKVKVTLRFRGREMVHKELGRDLLQRVERDLEDVAEVEQYPRMEGRTMVMMMGPKKSGARKAKSTEEEEGDA